MNCSSKSKVTRSFLFHLANTQTICIPSSTWALSSHDLCPFKPNLHNFPYEFQNMSVVIVMKKSGKLADNYVCHQHHHPYQQLGWGSDRLPQKDFYRFGRSNTSFSVSKNVKWIMSSLSGFQCTNEVSRIQPQQMDKFCPLRKHFFTTWDVFNKSLLKRFKSWTWEPTQTFNNRTALDFLPNHTIRDCDWLKIKTF